MKWAWSFFCCGWCWRTAEAIVTVIGSFVVTMLIYSMAFFVREY